MQLRSLSPPGSMHTHIRMPTEKEKNLPLFPAPCPSRQPQLQTQLLFSLQTTCYLGCQKARDGIRWYRLLQKSSVPLQVTISPVFKHNMYFFFSLLRLEFGISATYFKLNFYLSGMTWASSDQFSFCLFFA